MLNDPTVLNDPGWTVCNRDEAETWHTCLGQYLYKNCVFYSSRIRTLVAIATLSSHRLIMGKEEIDNFFCLIGDIWNFFLQKCLLSSQQRFFCPNR